MSEFNIFYTHENAYLKLKTMYNDNPVFKPTRARVTLEVWGSETTPHVAAKLYNTHIFMVNWHNDIKLNSGGWHSKTTKARINDLLPNGWGLYQKDYIWYICHFPNGKTEYSEYVFEDKMVLHENGTVSYNGEADKLRVMVIN